MISLGLLPWALLWDAVLGYPAWLYRSIGHPVSWMGWLIASSERRLNQPSQTPLSLRLRGGILLFFLIGLSGLIGWTLQELFRNIPFGWIGETLVAASLLAVRSLYTHVKAVATALEQDGPAAGRVALAQIVGRDVEKLDEGGVSRAAIESLAESFSDGVIGPILAYLIFGLPGIAIYKAVNTADSCIGHLNNRYRYFGWAAARTDDVLNLLPARLTALLISLVAGRGLVHSAKCALRDAGKHRSPNAGWPEAAMAGALSLRLGGPRRYGEHVEDGVWLGDGRARAQAGDIDRALRIYVHATMLVVILVLTGLAFS